MNPAAAGAARREGAASPAERNPARTVATVIAIVGALTGPVSFLSFPGFGAWRSEDLQGAWVLVLASLGVGMVLLGAGVPLRVAVLQAGMPSMMLTLVVGERFGLEVPLSALPASATLGLVALSVMPTLDVVAAASASAVPARLSSRRTGGESSGGCERSNRTWNGCARHGLSTGPTYCRCWRVASGS